ncbi:hypothetical protein ACIPJ2_17645 [Curtobacterium sp. NPDC090217]|uniref:TetR/AcrR family transcriptional regulator n=1 Tax=Curtobacterium sp. NPDC090217 TaxID=3363970 RepID=UPI00380FCF02
MTRTAWSTRSTEYSKPVRSASTSRTVHCLQLLGVAVARHVIQVNPLVEPDLDSLVAMLAPAIQATLVPIPDPEVA